MSLDLHIRTRQQAVRVTEIYKGFPKRKQRHAPTPTKGAWSF
jgi:hypothetical protein